MNLYNYFFNPQPQQQPQQQSQQQSQQFQQDDCFLDRREMIDDFNPNPINNNDSKAKMYSVSADIVRDRLKAENEQDLKMLQNLDNSEITVIGGSADHIESVLTAIGVPFSLISPEQIPQAKFKPQSTIYINCHTSPYPPKTIEIFQKFVKEGGCLITTDWTVNNILAPAFPDTVNWNNQSTQDEAVPMVCSKDDDDEILKSFKGEELWYLAGGSHAIQIVNPKKVKVLIESKELGQKYGGSAILVKFEYGDGVVYHMISHFHLQNSSTRPSHANNMTAQDYAMRKGATPDTIQKINNFKNDEKYSEDINYANMQSACTNSEFVMRSTIQQQKRKEMRK